MSAWGDEGFGLIVLGRAVYGLGVAFAMHAGPVLIAEVSTSGERGRLVALKEVGIVLGMLVGLLVAYGALDGSGGWRLTLGLPALPATLLLIGYAYIPASPR